MTGFLLMARFAMDDVPLSIHESMETAIAAMKGATYAQACDAARRVSCVDSSELCSFLVVPFVDGIPHAFDLELLRDLDKEPGFFAEA